MVILRRRWTFILFLLLNVGVCEDLIRSAVVKCEFIDNCARYEDEVGSIVSDDVTPREFKARMRHFLFDKTLRQLIYKIDESKMEVTVDVVQNRMVSNISYVSNIDVNYNSLKRILPLQEGWIFKERGLKDSVEKIKKFLSERGYSNAQVRIEERGDDNQVELLVRVKGGAPTKITKIDVIIKNSQENAEETMRSSLQKFSGKVWDEVSFSRHIEDLKERMLNRGYVDSDITYSQKRVTPYSVHVQVTLKLGEKRHFYFTGNKSFTRQEIIEAVNSRVKSVLGRFSLGELKKTLDDLYQSVGIYGTSIDVRRVVGKSLDGILFANYYCDITEGKKLYVEKITYRGNLLLQDDLLDELYDQNASILAARGFLDRQYISRFAKILRNEYLHRGFIFIDVEEPTISVDEGSATVSFEIREGQECLVRAINFKGVPQELSQILRGVMENQVDQPFDSQRLGTDLKDIIIRAKNEGYYFAEIINDDKSGIVKFTSDYSEVTIDVDLQLDKKTFLEEVIVSGNVSTKDEVIIREVFVEQGELLRYDDIVEIQKEIAGLGLFSTVEITPYVTNRESGDEAFKVNLLIRVQEIKFRSVELAPGYRSDIGLKASLGFNYNNWMGMNRSIGLRLQTNWRTNLDELDSRRRAEGAKMLEYSSKLKLSEPYLFGIGLGANLIFSVTRKRFYGYDADIRRVSSSFSKTLGKFSASLTYRFENIHQFDASESKDSGTFTIGGVTPSISLDLRDNKANPTKGIFIGLSSEFASPFWGSQKKGELEVDFVRTILRNKIYFPIGKWITACSVSFGYEKNMAGSGSYIPGIKVFRLTGIDTVRGFLDEEINKLASGADISEVTVNDRAYFFVMKIEPRYKLSDSTQLGIFYDFGRVYVDRFELGDVRSAFGVSFKFLTPVGSLNFDYGIKVSRKFDVLGKKEAFGRFHLQIGYF